MEVYAERPVQMKRRHLVRLKMSLPTSRRRLWYVLVGAVVMVENRG
jgi:hypothetical protein